MDIYVSSACLNGYKNFEDLVKLLDQAGLRHVEAGSGAQVGPGFKKKLLTYSCKYLIHNYFPAPKDPFVLNLASADSVIQQRSLNLVRQAIELSAELGAPFYSVHAGFVTDPYGFDQTHFLFPDPDKPEAYQYAVERFAKNLLLIDQVARQYQIKLLVENNVCWPELSGKLLLQTTDEFVNLFAMLNSDNLGILLDFGHLNVSAHTLGFERLEFIKQLSPFIRAFHVHDNDGIADRHNPIKSDSWVLEVLLDQPIFMDLPAIIEAHFQSISDLKTHVDWLSTVLAFPDKNRVGDVSGFL